MSILPIVFIVCFVLGAIGGFISGRMVGRRGKRQALDVAALYKAQADEMLERLTELENQLQGD